jgi:hypothetical protein
VGRGHEAPGMTGRAKAPRTHILPRVRDFASANFCRGAEEPQAA